jgi:hypothetical protein
MAIILLIKFSDRVRSVRVIKLGLLEVRGAVKKLPEMWCSTVMVGHMTTLT